MASFTDDFNRADTSTLGAGWVEVSGDWSIISNQLSPGSAGGTIILRAAGAMASDDHFVQATIAATTAASQGIWCRGNSNITNGYLWRNDGTSWDLFSVVGGSFNIIGTYAAAATPGDVAKAQAVGSTITAYVNGIQRVSVTNTDVPTGTSVGIRAESVGALRFDDFSAADVTAGATLGVATAVETAQPLTGSKTTTLGPAAASETAQQLAGSTTAALGTALEDAAAQALAGVKAVPLPVAAQAETAQPLTGTLSRILGTAATVEEARPLTGAKSFALGTTLEASTARPLVAAGSTDADIDITVGAPYGSPYSAGAPHASDWKVGAPC